MRVVSGSTNPCPNAAQLPGSPVWNITKTDSFRRQTPRSITMAHPSSYVLLVCLPALDMLHRICTSSFYPNSCAYEGSRSWRVEVLGCKIGSRIHLGSAMFIPDHLRTCCVSYGKNYTRVWQYPRWTYMAYDGRRRFLAQFVCILCLSHLLLFCIYTVR